MKITIKTYILNLRYKVSTPSRTWVQQIRFPKAHTQNIWGKILIKLLIYVIMDQSNLASELQ